MTVFKLEVVNIIACVVYDLQRNFVSQGFVNSDVSWKGVGFAIAFGR